MLAKVFRLTRERDFAQVYKHGELTQTPHLLVRRKRTGQPHLRVGIVVSTKVAKKATIRNWYKRRLRVWVRPWVKQIQAGWDVIITLRRQLREGEELAQIEEELRNYFVGQSW